MVCKSSSVVELAVFDALDAFESVVELSLSELSVFVVVALLHSQQDIVFVVGRSQTHLQAEVSVGLVETLALDVSCLEVVVMMEHMLDFVGQHGVVDLGLPSFRVIYSVVAFHASITSVISLPSVVGMRLNETLLLGSLSALAA